MYSPVVIPRTVRLPLPSGAWVLVKEQLNAGEMMDLFDASASDDRRTVDGTKAGLAMICTYLVDWSFVDPQGGPIRLESATMTRAALRSFNFETFSEILMAVQTHDAATRQEKKRVPPDDPASSASLPSLVAAGGVTSG